MVDKAKIDEYNKALTGCDVKEILKYFLAEFKGRIALSSSLSIEDQVLLDKIIEIDRDTRIFTLDTGRLPNETYNLIDRTNHAYNIKMEVLFPDYNLVEAMVKEKGMNLFYENVENRKNCCFVRKIEPLRRALKSLDMWITGLRREQSVTRESVELVAYDETNGLLKLSPLYNWTEDEVWDYVKKNNVPYNALYNKNYLSIGCAPCTRAVKKGEDIRSGRWWWENPDTKECGLHI